jgi:hypothetical protein
VSGVLRGDRLEALYLRHLGDLTLGQLRTPTYCPGLECGTAAQVVGGMGVALPDLPV